MFAPIRYFHINNRRILTRKTTMGLCTKLFLSPSLFQKIDLLCKFFATMNENRQGRSQNISCLLHASWVTRNWLCGWITQDFIQLKWYYLRESCTGQCSLPYIICYGKKNPPIRRGNVQVFSFQEFLWGFLFSLGILPLVPERISSEDAPGILTELFCTVLIWHRILTFTGLVAYQLHGGVKKRE